MKRILVLNPGSTSTKLAIYEDRRCVYEKNISYTAETLGQFHSFSDQYEMRKKDILDFVHETGLDPEELTAIAARGSGFGPMEAGAYEIDADLEKACHEKVRHVSYLATVISYEIIKEYGIKGYVYDCQSAIELPGYAKLSGIPQLERRAGGHVLNSRAAARKAAEQLGKRYEDGVYIVAHLGGGCSTTLHENGRIIDVIGGDEGTFTPERAGRLPMRAFTRMCFSGKTSRQEIESFFTGKGGFVAYLNTNDARTVAKMMADGDENAKLVCEAMAYQITKDIGALYAVMPDRVDAIVLTGGLAYFEELMEMVIGRVSKLATTLRFPGSFEMEALAYGVLRVLNGEEKAHILRKDGTQNEK